MCMHVECVCVCVCKLKSPKDVPKSIYCYMEKQPAALWN